MNDALTHLRKSLLSLVQLVMELINFSRLLNLYCYKYACRRQFLNLIVISITNTSRIINISSDVEETLSFFLHEDSSLPMLEMHLLLNILIPV